MQKIHQLQNEKLHLYALNVIYIQYKIIKHEKNTNFYILFDHFNLMP